MTPLFAFFLVAVQPPAPTPPPDPRIELVELQDARQSRDALRLTNSLLAERPEWSHEMGLDFLRGHLLGKLGRHSAAARAYADAIGASPALQSPALLRIADVQLRLGHPEVAAGVLAALLRKPTSPALAETAAAALVRSLAQGGDCRLLRTFEIADLPTESRRRIAIARIDCDVRAGRRENLAPSLLGLIEEDQRDLAAKHAADRYSRLDPQALETSTWTRLGGIFHQHRDFPRAVRYLEPVVRSYSKRLGKDESGIYYKLVRSYYWNGDLQRAVESYGDLADRTTRSEDRARALYQQGRSYEQLGLWSEATKSYRRAFLADREGEFSGSSLMGALRLQWRSGQESSISDILDLLLDDRRRSQELGRAMLFLASSDIVRGRTDRAGRWLSIADTGSRAPVEVAYWRGRMAELDSDFPAAVKHYSNAVRTDAYHPLALAAQRRLQSEWMAPLSIEAAQRLAASSRPRDLAFAWRMLGDDHPDGLRARERLQNRLAKNRTAKAFLDLRPVAPRDWPLWHKALDAPEEKLLGLGLWSEANPVVLRHFPFSNLALAYTASAHLARNGRTERSIYIAEVLNQGVPKGVPPALLPRDFRKLLYPIAYPDKISEVAQRYGVDPYLLLSIFRQESRFDPMAVSSASARGLGQFVFPTAARIAKKIGRPLLRPEELEDPATSIELAAAYVKELGQQFDGTPHRVIAAYNAGEIQSRLWGIYCYSWEPEEYYTKISFPETRNYLEQVLRSRAHYREIHGPWPDPPRGILAPQDRLGLR